LILLDISYDLDEMSVECADRLLLIDAPHEHVHGETVDQRVQARGFYVRLQARIEPTAIGHLLRNAKAKLPHTIEDRTVLFRDPRVH
jgi:hypothetical protein